MLTPLKTLVSHCLTGIDGETYDPARVYLALAVAGFLAATLYAIYKGQAFDAQAYGIGFGALLAAGGLGVRLKSRTEPEQS